MDLLDETKNGSFFLFFLYTNHMCKTVGPWECVRRWMHWGSTRTDAWPLQTWIVDTEGQGMVHEFAAVRWSDGVFHHAKAPPRLQDQVEWIFELRKWMLETLGSQDICLIFHNAPHDVHVLQSHFQRAGGQGSFFPSSFVVWDSLPWFRSSFHCSHHGLSHCIRKAFGLAPHKRIVKSLAPHIREPLLRQAVLDIGKLHTALTDATFLRAALEVWQYRVR
jgi:hypothetical protein